MKDHRPILINYLYFGSLFALLVLLSVSHILIREDLGSSHIFFIFFSIGEAALEVLLFIATGWLVRRYLPMICFGFFIGLTFLCFLLHLVDFMLEKIMNFSIFETLAFVFDESLENFMKMLEASGIPIWLWFAAFGLMALIPLAGIAIYWMTHWVTSKKRLGIRLEFLFQALFCVPIALFLWDYSASRVLDQDTREKFHKSLPWKVTFLHPTSPTLTLPHPLNHPPVEKEILARIETAPLRAEKKPNIYLFIVESLRDDIIVPDIAPHLSAFKERNLHSDLSLSCANATMISWFSLFHSNYPYYWRDVKNQGWSSGSPALAALKKMGYEIRVYSSANLTYYRMDELLFGKETHLTASLQTFPHNGKEAWQSDVKTIDAFERDLEDKKSGQCFVFFWDASHFDYSWPKEETLFVPVAKELDYFMTYHSQENIEAIKNRYRNSVHFIDALFGRFLSLVEKDQEALIVFTGDHGEEFFEHGHLFHLSQLSDVQTHVPLYFKLGQRKAPVPRHICHMDIFPTLFDALGENPSSLPLFGQSLFKENRWPYSVISRYNASRSPYEFCLHNGSHKLIVRFSNPRDIFASERLEIQSLRTSDDLPFDDCKKDLDAWIRKEFGAGLEKLFPHQEKSSEAFRVK